MAATLAQQIVGAGLVRPAGASSPPARGACPGPRRLPWLRPNRPLRALAATGIGYFLRFQHGARFGNAIAVKDYVPSIGFCDSPWAGLDHIKNLFGGPAFWCAVLNTGGSPLSPSAAHSCSAAAPRLF